MAYDKETHIKNELHIHHIFTPLAYAVVRKVKGKSNEVIRMMYGFDSGVGAIWMIIIWALPVIAVVALLAALAKNKVQSSNE